jgi:hypothetical protein
MNVAQFHTGATGMCRSRHVSVKTGVDQECAQKMRIESPGECTREGTREGTREISYFPCI